MFLLHKNHMLYMQLHLRLMMHSMFIIRFFHLLVCFSSLPILLARYFSMLWYSIILCLRFWKFGIIFRHLLLYIHCFTMRQIMFIESIGLLATLSNIIFSNVNVTLFPIFWVTHCFILLKKINVVLYYIPIKHTIWPKSTSISQTY